MPMKKMIQIYTGGIKGRDVTFEEVKSRLEELKGNRPEGIIAGWSLDKELYRRLREYTAERHMEFYLWFQTFSEFKRLKDFDSIMDIEGKMIEPAIFDGDEEFSFYCPGNNKTTAYLKEIYEEYFSDVAFDGVLLDRIRFPSPVYSREAIFSCCCNNCLKKYKKYGIGKADILDLKKWVRENEREDNILGIKEYKNGRYIFRIKEIEQYLYARAGIITEAVRELTEYFRAKGMKTGLDLFAPFLSLFVGQNYMELGQQADFIKPMLYRYTQTPAGMEYELTGMVQALSNEQTKENRLQVFRKLTGVGDNDWTEFMTKEVRNARAMTGCELYIGMEVHTIPELKPIQPEQIKEGVMRLQRIGASGRIASWNLLAADKENISAFMGDEYGQNDKTYIGI